MDATSPLKFRAFEPKAWEETDVDIKISHCGVCASDIHTLRSGWVSKADPIFNSSLLVNQLHLITREG